MDEPVTPRAQRRIIDLVHTAAEAFGTARAIVDESATCLTFLALREEVLRAAAAFVAAGVERGDRIAVWAPNCAGWIVAALGMQTIGAVLVPLNTRFKAAEATYILRRVRPRLPLTVGDFLGQDYAALLEAELGGPGQGRPYSELPEMTEVVLLDGALRQGRRGWSQMLWVVDIWNRANDLRAGDRQLIVNPFSILSAIAWVSSPA